MHFFFLFLLQKNAEYVSNQLKKELKDCLWFSLAFDESTDLTDIAQLSIFIRYVTEDFDIRTEFLDLIGMKDTTTGEDVFDAITNKSNGVVKKFELDISKLVSLSTDGAPSMIGKTKGAVARIQKFYRDETNTDWKVIGVHCLIHQLALSGKIDEKEDSVGLNLFGSTITLILKVINLIRGKSALRHRQFDEFIKEINDELGYHYHSLHFISCKLKNFFI
jgi:hypothetical protein